MEKENKTANHLNKKKNRTGTLLLEQLVFFNIEEAFKTVAGTMVSILAAFGLAAHIKSRIRQTIYSRSSSLSTSVKDIRAQQWSPLYY